MSVTASAPTVERRPAEPSGDRPTAPIWARGWVWAALALLATAPFWFVSIPPLPDFPGHLGRYHVMLHLGRSPDLARFYDFHWALVGNLGADLAMLGLGPLLGDERAAWLIAAVTPGLMVLGIFATSRAVHGRVPATSFLALPFVYANAFEWGFLNYDLAVALMLLAFALWVSLRSRAWLRAGLFIPLSFGLWVCHAEAWGLFGLFVGGYEAQQAISQHGWRVKALRQVALRVWPAAPPIALCLTMLAPSQTPYEVTAAFAGWLPGIVGYKAFELSNVLHDRRLVLDAASMLAIAGLYIFARSRGARFEAALAAPAALVGAAVILMPPIAAGSALADYRLAPMALIALLLSIRLPANSGSGSGLIVATALGITIVRLTATAIGWREDDGAYARHLTALNQVPAGSRILVLTPGYSMSPWKYGTRPLSHLGDLAIVRRDALVNSQWTAAGAQLLTVKGNADIAYHIDPSQFIAAGTVDRVIAAAPLDHFDFVWVLGRDPSAARVQRLQTVYADEETRMFKVPPNWASPAR